MQFINLKTMTASGIMPDCRFIVCLGNFDGVHKGHAALLHKAIGLKASFTDNTDIKTAVWFFSELPSNSYLANTPVITTLSQKLDLLAAFGIDYAIVADFRELCDFPPDRFIKEILVSSLNTVELVVGYNFRFGKGASGDTEILKQYFKDALHIIPKVSVDGLDVSSSLIRDLLGVGEIEKANSLLGHPFSLRLQVTDGKHLGRTLGFPTVNQKLGVLNIPLPHGVYATKCTIDGTEYPCVTNIGVRPTVENTSVANAETHIIGYSGNLYGQELSIDFYSKIRDEIRFDNIDNLKKQVSDDIRFAKSFFE